MNNKIISIGAGVVAVIALIVGIGAANKTVTVPDPVVQQQVVRGAPDFSNSPYITVNGVTEWFTSVPMNFATTTVCAIPTPEASSSQTSVNLRYVSWRTNNTLNPTAQVMEVGTSTTSQGTTTEMIAQTTIAASGTAATSFSGWIAGGNSTQSFANSILKQGTYINFTTNATSSTITGTCQAGFTQF